MYKMDSKDKIVCGVICICGLFMLETQISKISATSKLEKTLAAAKDLPNTVKPVENIALNKQSIKIYRGSNFLKNKTTNPVENIDHNNQTVRIYRGSDSQKKEIFDPKENITHNDQTVRIYKGSDSQKKNQVSLNSEKNFTRRLLRFSNLQKVKPSEITTKKPIL